YYISCFSLVSSFYFYFFFFFIFLVLRSTLFPYTTLFRSMLFIGTFNLELLIGNCYLELLFGTVILKCQLVVLSIGCINLELLIGDRKSTRLNSSHRTISYAVFCLKKKKIK